MDLKSVLFKVGHLLQWHDYLIVQFVSVLVISFIFFIGVF